MTEQAHGSSSVSRRTFERRPVVFGVEAASSHHPARDFLQLRGVALTRAGRDVHEFRRSQRFGDHDALNYHIIANWVIAAHKSQGLFQMDAGRHDIERFWRFEVSGPGSAKTAEQLFDRMGQVEIAGLQAPAGASQ